MIRRFFFTLFKSSVVSKKFLTVCLVFMVIFKTTIVEDAYNIFLSLSNVCLLVPLEMSKASSLSKLKWKEVDLLSKVS